jgi:MFS family permease
MFNKGKVLFNDMHHENKVFHYLAFNKLLTEFYFMISFRSFAVSMISIFLPIFIYTIRNSLFDLVLFAFFTYASMFVFSPFAAKMTSKIGNAHTMLFSIPFMFAFFGSLYFFDSLMISIPLLGVLYGFYESFFWMPFHDEFSILSKTKKVGKEVGVYRALTIGTKILGPIIGALIITMYGFNLLFITIIGLTLIGLIPLLLTKDIKTKQPFSLKKSFLRKDTPLKFPFIGYGAVTFATVWLWPLLIFLFISAYLELGLFGTIVNTITVIGVLIIGFRADKINKIKLIKAGSILFSSSLLIRAFATTIFQALSAWIFGALTWPLLDVPFEALTYAKSKKLNKLEFFVAREHALCIGRFSILGVVAILLFYPTIALPIAIFVSGLFGLLYWKV